MLLFVSASIATVSPADQAFYEANGYVTLRGVFNASESALLASWVEEIAAWPPSDDGKWLHHYERTEHGVQLSRTEGFVSYHPQLGRRLMAGRVPELVAPLLGDEVFLYKEKINYKYPGGAGYNAHQDAPAYKQVNLHATALVAVEPATMTNGCLEFAAGHHTRGLIGLTDEGILSPEAEAALGKWTPCEMDAGDVTVFSSYVPHRSRPNLSGGRRALLYLTYNAQAEGYLRDEYYRHKRQTMKSGQLSLIKHFQGIALEAPSALSSPTTIEAEGEACDANAAVGAAAAVNATLHELRLMFATHGASWYDPTVTQQQHALQSASLAERSGTASDELVSAALLHDVGHLLLDEHMDAAEFLKEDKQHELAGADYLAARFPPSVSEPVRLHVPAKRYLCHSKAGYWGALSDNSKRSLEVQGGTFSDDEAAAFIAQPHAPAAAELRMYDDRAKAADAKTADLEYFLMGAVRRVLLAKAEQRDR